MISTGILACLGILGEGRFKAGGRLAIIKQLYFSCGQGSFSFKGSVSLGELSDGDLRGSPLPERWLFASFV